ncbi:MAG: hypothetical protein HYS06_09835 [Methylocystis sp.]|nr:hypothetical protein [Methylocystis sp.]
MSTEGNRSQTEVQSVAASKHEFASLRAEFNILRGEFNTVKWMLATNLTLTLLVLGKLFLR